MRFTIINREEWDHAGATHLHQAANRGKCGFVGRKEVDKLTVLWSVVLIRQIVAPVSLTYGLNKRLDTIVTRMQTTAKTTTYGIPDKVVDFVALVMEHGRHLLTLRSHQHRRNVDTPTVRNEENHLLVIATHFVNDFQPFPVNTVNDFFRPFQRQLCHHCHCLRRGGIHRIDDSLALGIAFFGKTVIEVDLRTATRAFA